MSLVSEKVDKGLHTRMSIYLKTCRSTWLHSDGLHSAVRRIGSSARTLPAHTRANAYWLAERVSQLSR